MYILPCSVPLFNLELAFQRLKEPKLLHSLCYTKKPHKLFVHSQIGRIVPKFSSSIQFEALEFINFC